MGDLVLEPLEDDDANEQPQISADGEGDERQPSSNEAPTLYNFVRKAALRLAEQNKQSVAKARKSVAVDLTAAEGKASEGETERRDENRGWLEQWLEAEAPAGLADKHAAAAPARTAARSVAPEKEPARLHAMKRRRHTDYGS